MRPLSKNLRTLVTLLNCADYPDSHRDRYHDGETLGAALGVSRNTIWKTINKLIDYGIAIDAIKGRGYRLVEPLTLLDEAVIRAGLIEKAIDLKIFETIDSTNAFLHGFKSKQPIALCLAEQQTAGRGRFARTWHSPFGQNIYMSCRYPFMRDISTLGGLSLAVSLAILQTVQHFAPEAAIQLKWPNDVLYQQKKLAGSLIEIRAESHSRAQAIIGIGLNVNMLAQTWASVRAITHEVMDRNIVCIQLINVLLTTLHTFAENGLTPFIAQWLSADALFNQAITLHNGKQKISGIGKGIDAHGQLIMQLEDGTQQHFSAGETSLHKMNCNHSS